MATSSSSATTLDSTQPRQPVNENHNEAPAAETRPPIKHSRAYRVVYPTLKPLVAMFLMLLLGVRGHHVDRAVRKKSYLLLSNHQSYPDPIFLGMVSPRPMHFMARDNLFRPGLKQLITMLGAYPVTRGRRDERAFRHTQELMERGASVVIFGEGTRTPHGDMQPIRGGVEILARRTQATIVPMALDGAFQMAPRNLSMKHLRAEAIHIVVGQPIEPEEYLAWPHRRIPSNLQPRLQALLEEARQRRERAGRGGILTLSRPAIEMMTAYYRFFLGLLKALTRRRKRR